MTFTSYSTSEMLMPSATPETDILTGKLSAVYSYIVNKYNVPTDGDKPPSAIAFAKLLDIISSISIIDIFEISPGDEDTTRASILAASLFTESENAGAKETVIGRLVARILLEATARFRLEFSSEAYEELIDNLIVCFPLGGDRADNLLPEELIFSTLRPEEALGILRDNQWLVFLLYTSLLRNKIDII